MTPLRRTTIPLVAIALALGACGDGAPDTAGPDTAGPGATTAGAEPSTEAATEPRSDPGTDVGATAEPADVRVALETIASGFVQPVGVEVDPRDSSLVVLEQEGRLTRLEDGEVLLDVSELTRFQGEQGLLDALFHPAGDRVYVHHSGTDGQTILAEYATTTDGGIDAGSRTVQFTTDQPAANHNGGSLELLEDGTMLLALGDGGRAGDAFDQAQDTSTPLGGLLRFDVSVPGTMVPAGAGFDEPALWSYGLRNPWRIEVADGLLYVADVGQDAVEEVSVVALEEAAGANFGWPFVEGDTCYSTEPCEGDFVESVVELRHRDAGGPCSITGGVVYPGDAIPGLAGTYLYSDLCAGILEGIVVEGGQVHQRVDLTDQVDAEQVVGFALDADGEVLLTELDGDVRRLVPA